MRFSWAIFGALAVYCLWAGLLILQNPGLQYDEALLVLGSVHMRHSAVEIPLPHDPNSWFCPFNRCFPLMTVRYVGAVKEYLGLPVFAVFGPSAQAVRILSMLLGALGIYGVAALVAAQAGPAAAAITAGVIAMNPAYVDLTVFDNGTVSIWMAALGILCLAITHYLGRQTWGAAFWLGVAVGFGVWARANFVWMLTAVSVAVLVVLRKRLLGSFRNVGPLALGGVVGGAPFLLYQVLSHGGTWEAVGMFTSQESLGHLLRSRFSMFSETLLSDYEHRAIWDGPLLPDWQRWLLAAVVLGACVACLMLGRLRFAKATALAFVFLAAFLFSSKMPVAEHHMIVLTPLAAVVIVLAGSIVASRYRAGRAIVSVLAVLYFGLAIYWQTAAIRGLWHSGGTGQWSDAVFTLSDYLQQKYPDREIKILDWGLQNNLYVLSDSKIRSRELYGGDSDDQISRWIGEVRRGGVFLLNGPANRQFPAASIAFLRALAVAHPNARRFTINQENGVPYAQIVEIEPDTVQGL